VVPKDRWAIVMTPNAHSATRTVNYSKRELQVSDVTATYLRTDEGPAFENVPGGEYRIPPRRSWQVTCRRTLLDAETKAVSAAPVEGPAQRRTRSARARRRREEAGVGLLGGAWASGAGSAVSRRTPRSHCSEELTSI